MLAERNRSTWAPRKAKTLQASELAGDVAAGPPAACKNSTSQQTSYCLALLLGPPLYPCAVFGTPTWGERSGRALRALAHPECLVAWRCVGGDGAMDLWWVVESMMKNVPEWNVSEPIIALCSLSSCRVSRALSPTTARHPLPIHTEQEWLPLPPA